ncbi:methyltransferase domain-containing protein (plasmid) [Tistrella bauzanensis]|uniref:methyltransferase domain-containing protein n=1 Tax=Tistrella TaxID=171436 RepID=UPI0031F70DC9
MSATFMDRLVDRIARRPGGMIGRLLYRHPAGHKTSFDMALDALGPTPDDRLLDLGCGGGVFLERVLNTGASAAGLDHSPDMVGESRRRNAAACAAGRLTLCQGDVGRLPFPDGAFSIVTTLNAFFFFPDPQAAVAEMARVLAPGGRLAIVTTPPEQAAALKRYFGPVASRMRLDAPEALADWLRTVGLVPGAARPVRAVGYLITARKPLMPAATGAVIEMPGFHGRITGRIGDLLVVEADVTGAIPAHTAQGAELVVVLSGELHARIDGTERVLRPGEHALIPAGTNHAATVAGPTRLLLIGPPE